MDSPLDEEEEVKDSLEEFPIPGVEFLQLPLQLLLLAVLPEVVGSLLLPPLGVFHHFLPFSLQFLGGDLSVWAEEIVL